MNKRDTTVSLREAQSIILASVTPLGGERVPLLEAANRVLREDIVSSVMLPPRDCSAMDGYALRAADTREATREHPVRLRVTGEIQAGGSPQGLKVEPGDAVRIMTGAPMPAGADAVVRFEDSEEDDGWVRVFRPLRVYQNYRHAGENIERGELVLRQGERLNSADIGILASLNHDTVQVYRRPRVAIISTGDELVGLGQDMAPGQIRDVNAHALYAEVMKYKGLPTLLGIARDSRAEVRALFSQALDYDLVLSSGGGSMGRYDYVKDVYGDLGIELEFERVNIKPGKPCSFGTREGKLFFSLPGNPLSAMTTFIQFVRPALLRLMGTRNIFKPVVWAVLDEDISKKPSSGLRLLRGCFTLQGHEFHVITTGNQKSGIFKSMRDANCLIVVPKDSGPLRAGDQVMIQLIAHGEISPEQNG